jgi:hypothetical protein
MVTPTNCYALRSKAAGTVVVNGRYRSGDTEWQDDFTLTVQ